MANKKIMTKEELQAKHRLEEAQMRDRAKERKARTRRLIQEGAVLEKVFPEAQQMELEKLEDLLYRKATLIYEGRSGQPGRPLPFLSRRGRTYSPPAKQAVVSLPLVGLVRSSRTVHRTLLQRGQEMPQADIPCAVGASADAEIAACRTNPADTPASCLRKPATGSFIADMGSNEPISLCEEKQKPRVAFYPPLTKYESR